MVSFTTNKIFLDAETVSEQLRRTRQDRNLKLTEVAKKLSIKEAYLEALEKNEFWKLPKGVYGKNFLREYAIFLGLNYKELLENFDRETVDKEKEKNLFSTQVVKNSNFLAMPRIARNLVIAIVVLACFVYLGYRLNKIVSPPSLTIDSPQENLITGEKEIEVKGVSEAETQIVINGELVLADSQGSFLKRVDLKNGINTITVMAKKKYGRANIVERQILVK